MSVKRKEFYPTLSKAPISLAILEIRYETKEGISNEGLREAYPLLKSEFPTHNYTHDTQFEFRPNDINNTSIVQLKSNNISGNIFISESRKHEILLTNATYNFKQHGTYTTWDEFKTQALRGWNNCKDLLKPVKINWTSLRYINNIEIPIKPDDLISPKDIFKTFIATEEPNNLRSLAKYYVKYSHVDDARNLVIHFGQELVQGQPGILPFIVDIDVIFNQPMQYDRDYLEKRFDELRDIKNDYFFRNLTESTLKLLR